MEKIVLSKQLVYFLLRPSSALARYPERISQSGYLRTRVVRENKDVPAESAHSTLCSRRYFLLGELASGPRHNA